MECYRQNPNIRYETQKIKKKSAMNDFYARWSYEKLRLSKPHIETRGLFKSGERYKIHIPSLATFPAKEKGELCKWFSDNKALSSPIVLVASVDSSDKLIKNRTPKEVASLSGEPMTSTEVFGELQMRLGMEFPNFYISDDEVLSASFTTEQPLDDYERVRVKEVLESLQLPVTWNLKVEPNLRTTQSNKGKRDFLRLATAKSESFRKTSPRVNQLLQKDEDLWVGEGRAVLSGTPIDDTSVNKLRKKMRRSEGSLLNASIFLPDNIRNHISLFSNTKIVLPLAENQESALLALGMSRKELVELVNLGQLEIIIPYSLERYDLNLIDEILETNPDSVVPPRTVATLLVGNIHEKLPFLFPPGNIDQKQDYLRALNEIVTRLGGLDSIPFIALSEFHREFWSSFEYTFNQRGAAALYSHGPGVFLANLFGKISDQNLALEFGYADLGVGLSSALKAIYFPHEGSEQWSDEGPSALLASVYKGGYLKKAEDFRNRLETVLDGVLSIRKDVPLIQLATAIGDGDVARLRKHVFELAVTENIPTEKLQTAVTELNKGIKAIEKKKARLSLWNFSGIGIGTAMAAGGAMSTNPGFGMIIGAVAGLISTRVLNEIPDIKSRYPLAGGMLDSLESILLRTTPDKVLLARLRKRIRNRV